MSLIEILLLFIALMLALQTGMSILINARAWVQLESIMQGMRDKIDEM